MRSRAFRYVAGRMATAALLLFLVSSSAFVLASIAPGDPLSGFEVDQAYAAAERQRLGLDRPVFEQYVAWLSRGVRLDLGDSLRFRRPVTALLRERAWNTAMLGICALVCATAIGIPLGVVSGAGRGPARSIAGGASLILLSMPPLVTSLVLLTVALRSGATLPRLLLPAVALALPLAAVLERLQSRALAEALAEPSILAAIGRGIPRRRVIWRHGLRLSLKPVLAIYGLLVGGVLSGSFVVEIVMDWPGLGHLMFEALASRDLYLVAGCGAAVAFFLAIGVLLSDLALLWADPRVEAQA